MGECLRNAVTPYAKQQLKAAKKAEAKKKSQKAADAEEPKASGGNMGRGKDARKQKEGKQAKPKQKPQRKQKAKAKPKKVEERAFVCLRACCLLFSCHCEDKDRDPHDLGCGKCRWSNIGCKQCRQRERRARRWAKYRQFCMRSWHASYIAVRLHYGKPFKLCKRKCRRATGARVRL